MYSHGHTFFIVMSKLRLYPKDDDINLIERVAFSIGLSIVIVPLIGFELISPCGDFGLIQS